MLFTQLLIPFPGRDENVSKNYHVSAYAVLEADLRLGFTIKADPLFLASIILPEQVTSPKRMPDLWKTTCFECFIPSSLSKGYLEFNGSPSGDWNWYAFKQYRVEQPSFPVHGCYPKRHFWRQADDQIECEWIVPLSNIEAGFHSIGENTKSFDRIGITLVMQTNETTLYWALQHDGQRPDFHVRSSFIYPIR